MPESTARVMPHGMVELANEAISALGKNENCIPIRNHGVLACGRRMDDAGELALDVHERALE